MAKKVSKARGDTLPNRKYIVCTWAGAATTVAYEQVSTMMGAREGAGWLISRVTLQPLAAAPMVVFASSSVVNFQLMTGKQTTLLAADDDNVVMAGTFFEGTGAGINRVFPLTLIGPILIASKDLTVAMDAAADTAPLSGSSWLFTIWYNWVNLGAKEWVEIAEAKGIA